MAASPLPDAEPPQPIAFNPKGLDATTYHPRIIINDSIYSPIEEVFVTSNAMHSMSMNPSPRYPMAIKVAFYGGLLGIVLSLIIAIAYLIHPQGLLYIAGNVLFFTCLVVLGLAVQKAKKHARGSI